MRKDGSRQRLFFSFLYNPQSWPYTTRRCIIVAAKMSQLLILFPSLLDRNLYAKRHKALQNY